VRLGAGRKADVDGSSPRAKLTRREELLEIAAELFAARGFASVTVDDIGAAAGVSGPALYHHFDSKDSILGEMIIDICRHECEGGRALRETSPPDRLLDDLIDLHVDLAVDHRALATVYFRDFQHASTADQRRARALQHQYLDIWVEALLAHNPDLSEAIARPAVQAALSLINSTQYSPRVRRSDLVALLRTMARAALAAVAASDGDTSSA
jgi:AcrR family transcriptional regulator